MSFVAVAIGGSALLGAGASLMSSDQQSQTARDNAFVQAASTDKQLQLQRDAAANAKTQLTPYSVEGGKARQASNALLGLGGHGDMAATPGAPDFAAYVANNPDLAAAAAASGRDPASFGAEHWQEFGQREGRTLPTTAGAPASGAISADDAQNQAMDEYRKSPFYTTTRASGEAGKNAILSTAAASGRGTVSGKAERAVSDFTNENDQAALQSYLTSLNGVGGTGFQADAGIASGGTNFANNASSTLQAGTSAQTAAAQAAAQAKTNGLNDASGFAGWGVSQLAALSQPKVPVSSFSNYSSFPSSFETPSVSSISAGPRYTPVLV